jgi:hypothetical protein
MFREHWKSRGRPPNNVAAGRTDIDTGCNPPCTAPQTVLVLKKQVQTAAASSMYTRRREAMPMLTKPTIAPMTRVDVQNIEP